MFRSLFLALGVSTAILGVEALGIEKAVLKRPENAPVTTAVKEVNPPDWAPWSLMAAGAVVVLYSFTIPRRVNA